MSDCTRAVDLLRQQLKDCDDETDGQDGAPGRSDGLDWTDGVMDGQGQFEYREGSEARGSGREVSMVPEGRESEESASQESTVAGTEQIHIQTQEDGSVERTVGEIGAFTKDPTSRSSQNPERPSSKPKDDVILVDTGVPLESADSERNGRNENGGAPGCVPPEIAEPERNGQNGTAGTAGRPKRPSERERIRTALVKALVRRAAAQCEKALLTEAISDYESALRLDPGNRGIEKDLEAVIDCVKPPTQSEWKVRGDARYREGEIEGALEAYTRAVDCEVRE